MRKRKGQVATAFAIKHKETGKYLPRNLENGRQTKITRQRLIEANWTRFDVAVFDTLRGARQALTKYCVGEHLGFGLIKAGTKRNQTEYTVIKLALTEIQEIS